LLIFLRISGSKYRNPHTAGRHSHKDVLTESAAAAAMLEGSLPGIQRGAVPLSNRRRDGANAPPTRREMGPVESTVLRRIDMHFSSRGRGGTGTAVLTPRQSLEDHLSIGNRTTASGPAGGRRSLIFIGIHVRLPGRTEDVDSVVAVDNRWRGERYDGTSTRTGQLQSKKN